MKKLILLTLIITVIISCKKSKDDAPACTTDIASISGSYKIIAYMHSVFPDSCDRDNIYKFTSNGSYQIMDIGLVCFPSGDDDGTWQLVSATAMKIDGDPIVLESFDCKTLVIVNTDTQQQGDRVKITMRRQ
jgi:hypothetical protein